MQTQFEYDAHVIAALQDSVSQARLGRYETRACGDPTQALQLYIWNTALSEALYGPMQGLEITLRNKMNNEFTNRFGPHWYDMRAMGLANRHRDHVMCAKQSLQLQGKPLDPPRVVAELNFGFWVGLYGRQYENHLWRPVLRKIFINAPSPLLRKDTHQVLDDLRLLRNRIAHHEPILHRPLLREYRLILAVIGWLCSSTAAWVRHYSRFNGTYDASP